MDLKGLPRVIGIAQVTVYDNGVVEVTSGEAYCLISKYNGGFKLDRYDTLVHPEFLAALRSAIDVVRGARGCSICRKRFTPEHGEYQRCPECVAERVGQGEEATRPAYCS